MFKKSPGLFAFLLLITFINNAAAQNVPGEYFMEGGGEMASGFRLDTDSTFEFFLSYGAVDRTAKGTYSIKNDTVVFHGNKTCGKDFTIKSKKTSGSGATIKIVDVNPIFIQTVLCLFKSHDKQDIQYSDNKGYAHSDLPNCDTILVMHTLFPDIMTTIKPAEANNKNNYFELTLNPSLIEVCFKDFPLTIEGDTLTGSMPYIFEREKSVFKKHP